MAALHGRFDCQMRQAYHTGLSMSGPYSCAHRCDDVSNTFGLAPGFNRCYIACQSIRPCVHSL